MRRRVSDNALRRWLETGRPERLSKRISVDPALQSRLEELTALDDQQAAQLRAFMQPSPGFAARTTAGVRTRIDNRETLGVLADMFGLGFRVGALFVDPDDPLAEVDRPVDQDS